MTAGRLILWDVDGTLVRAGDLGAAAFEQALASVVGRAPDERVWMSGKTDPQIVREYLALMEVPDTDELVQAVLRAVEGQLAAAAATGELLETGWACTGVAEVLAALDGDDQVISSLLTGNVYPNALVKVGAFGLDRYLDLTVGAYGSDHHDRNELVPVALRRLEEERGLRFRGSDVWIVGDTPRDLGCARAAGARCLLVATGRYPLEELETLGADAALADLGDTGAVVNLLTAGL